MVIKSLKYLVKTVVLIVLMLSYANAEERESRALVVASQEAILSSELAARIENIAVKEMQRFKKGDLLIFPSTLDHFVTKNTAVEKRIAVSFNFKILQNSTN